MEQNQPVSKSIIMVKSFAFAVRIVKFYKILTDKKEFVLSKQVLRCGTSIGANVREAHNAESKNDFIHKMAIAQKECAETLYWLELLKETDFINQPEYDSLNTDAIEIFKIIRSIILTTKKRINIS